MLASAAPELFLDARERDVVNGALAVVADVSREQEALLRADLDRLAGAAEVVHRSSSITRSWHLQRRGKGAGEALVDALCKVRDYDLDLHIPTKAVLGQAFLVAKINFFKAIDYSLEPIATAGEVRERVLFELGQSIYTKLAEELYVSIVTDPGGAREVKLSAARSLFRIWEDRLSAEIDDFAPALEAVWEARNKVRPVLGALLGTHEVFALLREARDKSLLEYFGDDDVPAEQLQAFEEFLFGLSHEEIACLRAHLAERHSNVVSFDEATDLLEPRSESWAPHDGGPQALYTSYKRRKVKAHYRVLTGAAGPKKTAEEYVMVELIRRGLGA